MFEPMIPRVPGIGLAPHLSVQDPIPSSRADALFDAGHRSRMSPRNPVVHLSNDLSLRQPARLSTSRTAATPRCSEAAIRA